MSSYIHVHDNVYTLSKRISTPLFFILRLHVYMKVQTCVIVCIKLTYGRKPNPAASNSGVNKLELSSVRSAPAVSKIGTARVL